MVTMGAQLVLKYGLEAPVTFPGYRLLEGLDGKQYLPV